MVKKLKTLEEEIIGEACMYTYNPNDRVWNGLRRRLENNELIEERFEAKTFSGLISQMNPKG